MEEIEKALAALLEAHGKLSQAGLTFEQTAALGAAITQMGKTVPHWLSEVRKVRGDDAPAAA